jgi:transcriptional regulator with XRE-family HTH domain
MQVNEAREATGLDIKIARIKSGLRQYDVAFRVGIAPSRLSEIENGRRRVSSKLREDIFGVITGDVTQSEKPKS